MMNLPTKISLSPTQVWTLTIFRPSWLTPTFARATRMSPTFARPLYSPRMDSMMTFAALIAATAIELAVIIADYVREPDGHILSGLEDGECPFVRLKL